MHRTEVRSLLRDLASSQACFHGWAPEIEVNFGLNPSALDLLVDLVSAGQRTLETGVGYSTVAFAARGARHTVVSPFSFEHDRVRSWCDESGLDLSAVTFIAEPSQDVLPRLDPTPLDVVLIDGDHAFPTPFIDFLYAGARLAPGGLLIVDDTHLRACRTLSDFLRAESPRWRLHTELPTTSVFERLRGPLLVGWEAQPWGAVPFRTGPRPALWSRLRGAVRLRTRVRQRWHSAAP